MNPNKIIKIFLWILISSISISFFLLRNIDNDFAKKLESGQTYPTSGEGLGMLGVLLFHYLLYLIVFIDSLLRLNRSGNNFDDASKKRKLAIIFIFSIIPTLLIVLSLLIASPNPFKQYQNVKKMKYKIASVNCLI